MRSNSRNTYLSYSGHMLYVTAPKFGRLPPRRAPMTRRSMFDRTHGCCEQLRRRRHLARALGRRSERTQPAGASISFCRSKSRPTTYFTTLSATETPLLKLAMPCVDEKRLSPPTQERRRPVVATDFASPSTQKPN